MGHLHILIRRLLTRLLDIMRPERPLHSEQALLWERHGVEAGVGTADGVVAMLTLTSTTSTLTTITRTLTTTLTRRTLTKPTIIRPTRSIAVRGNIIRNIAEALLTTGRQQARSKINWQIGDRVEQELAIAPALEPAPEIGPVLAELELDQVLAELELVQVEVVPELDPLRAQLAGVLKTKSVTGVPRRDLVLIVAVALAAVAETTREPAAAEAVIAWAVAVTAVAEAAIAVAVVAVDVAAVE